MKVTKILHGKENVYEDITKVELYGGVIALYSGDTLVMVTHATAVQFIIEQ